MTKIDIFSGFLGAGKTTLLKKLIKEAYTGEKLVLIENEFGEIGIDGGFMQDAGIEITEMNSGCICCSLVGDFGKALEKVLTEFTPDRVLIEPSGVGKLSDVIRAVEGVQVEGAVLNGFTTVVDVNKCKMYMKNFGEFFNDQVENAGCIVLSHTGKCSDEKIAATVALLKEHNDHATVVTTDWDALTGAQLLAAMERTNTLENELKHLEAEAEEHRHHHHEGCGCGHHHEHEHHHEHGEECCCGHDHEHKHEHHHEHGEGCGCGHHHEHEHHHEHGEECCCGHDHEHKHEHHHEHGEECCCGHDHEHKHEHHHEHGEECCCGHDHEHKHEHHHEHGEECCCGHHDHEHKHEHHHHEHGEECCCGHHDHEHKHEHHHHEHGEECCCGHDHEHKHEHHHHEHGEECCCGHDHEHKHEHHHEHGESCSCGCGHDHDHGHHHADEIFTSWGVESTRKFAPGEINEILEVLSEGDAFGMILRAKGIVPCTDGTWIHFDYIPGEPDVRTGHADVMGRLCVIGAKIDKDGLAKLFRV